MGPTIYQKIQEEVEKQMANLIECNIIIMSSDTVSKLVTEISTPGIRKDCVPAYDKLSHIGSPAGPLTVVIDDCIPKKEFILKEELRR